MLLAIDRANTEPVWKQIQDRVATLVDEGSLPPGSRLPPTRVLAGRLGVDRSTVYRAYQELWALGYVESRPGSYTTVRARGRPVVTGPRAGPGVIDWAVASSPAARGVHDAFLRLPPREAPRGVDVVDFASLSADPALCPIDDLRRVVRGVLAERGRALAGYGDPAGYAPLRETIARRMRTHGVAISADQVLVTSGAQQALDLVLRLVARPGASIAVEVPTYSMAIPLVRLHGLELVEVPMRNDGADLDALERRFQESRPSLFYTVPNFQNPTGITTSQPHRERLLALCEAHRVPILEDGFEEEMKYFGRAVLPIKSMDASGVVIYVGTFSKVVFPGLRIGWIAAEPACIERLLAISRFTNLSGNVLSQAAVERFCRGGAYEAYLRRAHAVYRRRMQAMLKGLRAHMPARGVEWTEPDGGFTLWVRVVDDRADAEAALVEALEHGGVRVVAGNFFHPDGSSANPSFRLSIATVDEAAIEEGCRRLGRALARFIGG